MLESLYTGNEETYHKKKQIIASEKTKQVSQPKIQSKPALPTIRVAVKQLDRLSHTIGALLISENQQNLQSETLYRLTQNTSKEFCKGLPLLPSTGAYIWISLQEKIII